MIKHYKVALNCFPNALPVAKTLDVSCTYLTDDHLVMWLRAPSIDTHTICGIDIETYPEPAFAETFGAGLLAIKSKIRTIQIYDGKRVVVLDLMRADGTNITADRSLLSRICSLLKSANWAAHNAQFEVDHFTKLLELDGSPIPLFCACSRNAYRLVLQADTHEWQKYDGTLQGVSRRVLGVNVDKDIKHDRWATPGVLDEEQLNYCARDAILPRMLIEILYGNLIDLGMGDFFKLNTEMHNVIAHMHLFGNPIDAEAHEALCQEWLAKLKTAEAACFGMLNADRGFADAESAWQMIQDKISKKQLLPVANYMVDYMRESDWSNPLELQKLMVAFAAMSNKYDDKSTTTAFKRAGKNIEEHLINPGSDKQLSNWMKAHAPKHLLADWPLTPASVKYLEEWSSHPERKPEDVADASKLQLKMSNDVFEDMGEMEEIKPISDYKKYSRLYGTYGEGLKKFYVKAAWNAHPTVHSQYTMCWADTGRQSTNSPSVQNAPNLKEFRSIYVTRGPGYVFGSADFSQIELRISAEVTQDPVMLEVYLTGGDIHSETARAISSLDESTTDEETWKHIRKCAKIVNFSTIYGGGANAVAKGARKAGLKSPLHEYQSFIERYRERYYVARQYQIDNAEYCKKVGKVTVPYGKVCTLDPDYAYTQSANYPIQGAAAVVQFIAASGFYKFYCEHPELDFRILKLVHDSIDFDCRAENLETVRDALTEIMQNAMLVVFPDAPVFDIVGFSSGANWGEC